MLAFVSKQTPGVTDWIKLAADVICWRDLAIAVITRLVQ